MYRDEAVHTAIDTCIGKGILEDILIKQKAEVLHMILTEYDEKKHFRTLFREGKEEGIKEGIKEGMEIGLSRGFEQGREALLQEQVQKKLSRGKSVLQIAEELEEELTTIEQIVLNQNAK